MRRPRRIPNGPTVLPPYPAVPPFIASAVVPPRSSLPDEAATVRMAEDMREAGTREGGVSRDGLALLGWTGRQIDRLAGAARELAHRDAVMSL